MDVRRTNTFTDEQVRDLVDLLGTTGWAADRTLEGVERMLDGTHRAFTEDVGSLRLVRRSTT